MNRKSANTCLTDMINISIASFKLLLNEINQIENKNYFIIICEDALLSKGESNEETASQDHHLILHLCDTDTENTSLLVNNSNISLLFSPGHIHVNYFCWGFMASFIACIWSRTLQLRWRLSLLRDTKHCRAALDSRDTVSCCFHQRSNFFHH